MLGQENVFACVTENSIYICGKESHSILLVFDKEGKIKEDESKLNRETQKQIGVYGNPLIFGESPKPGGPLIILDIKSLDNKREFPYIGTSPVEDVVPIRDYRTLESIKRELQEEGVFD